MSDPVRGAARRPWPAGALLLVTAALCPGCARTEPTSVLLITIDTLRPDHLGCYGYPRTTSPRIDRLAAEGIVFERISASLPRTTQSIASIMTGRWPKGHGARGLFSRLPEANVTLAEILKGRGYRTAAFTSNMFLRPGNGFEQGFDRYDNPQHRWDGNSADEVASVALAWLRDLPPRTPFFLWAHFLDPHWTYDPGPPFDRAFGGGLGRDFTLYEDLRARRLTKGQVIFESRLGAREVEHLVGLYDGEIARTDAAVGRLLDGIDPASGRVMVVLTSDHGESLGEHGYHFAHGEYLYTPGLWIPLLVRLPGRIEAGLRSDLLGQNIDVAPTILAALGIDRMQSVDGRPLLIRAAGPGRDAAGSLRPAPGRAVVFAESDYELIHPENPRFFIAGPAGRWTAASDGRLKLIHIPTPGGAILEQYDLKDDPGETRNLEGEAAGGEERERLLRKLLGFADYGAGPPGAEGPAIGADERERLRSLGYIN